MHARATLDFETLYASLAPRVLALAFQMTGDASLAQDIMQDTFLAVHRGLKGYRGEAEPATWVYRIAINTSQRARRKRERASALVRESATCPGGSGCGVSASAEPAGTAALYRALGKLSDEHREVLSLLALRELSPPVIAEILGVPVGTVHSRCHHARARLRQELEGAKRQDASG